MAAATAQGNLTTELTELLGPLKMRKLLDCFCYKQLYIPLKPLGEDHPLVRCLGAEDARRLQAEYRGLKLQIPRGTRIGIAERNHAILQARAQGASVRQLMAEYGLSQRMVYYVLEG